MGEIIEEHDDTAPGKDGWTVRYRVRRDDGQEVDVQASCTATTAWQVHDEEAKRAVEDRCREVAIKYADEAPSPEEHGGVSIRIWFDGLSGSLRRDFDYGHMPPPE